MLDAERLVFRAIAQTPRPCALYSAISSRSEKKDNGPKAMQTRLRTLMGADLRPLEINDCQPGQTHQLARQPLHWKCLV